MYDRGRAASERQRVASWLGWMGYWPEVCERERGAEELRGAIAQGVEVLEGAALGAVLWVVVALALGGDGETR